MEPYIPVTDYKSHLYDSSILRNDNPFRIVNIYNNREILDAPVRGEFTLVTMPYGFYLIGFDTETQYTVLYSAGQGGTTSITVVKTSCNCNCESIQAHVRWEDESIAINDMLNKLYFGVRS